MLQDPDGTIITTYPATKGLVPTLSNKTGLLNSGTPSTTKASLNRKVTVECPNKFAKVEVDGREMHTTPCSDVSIKCKDSIITLHLKVTQDSIPQQEMYLTLILSSSKILFYGYFGMEMLFLKKLAAKLTAKPTSSHTTSTVLLVRCLLVMKKVFVFQQSCLPE